jgi:hypothetical protein
MRVGTAGEFGRFFFNGIGRAWLWVEVSLRAWANVDPSSRAGPLPSRQSPTSLCLHAASRSMLRDEVTISL